MFYHNFKFIIVSTRQCDPVYTCLNTCLETCEQTDINDKKCVNGGHNFDIEKNLLGGRVNSYVQYCWFNSSLLWPRPSFYQQSTTKINCRIQSYHVMRLHASRVGIEVEFNFFRLDDGHNIWRTITRSIVISVKLPLRLVWNNSW